MKQSEVVTARAPRLKDVPLRVRQELLLSVSICSLVLMLGGYPITLLAGPEGGVITGGSGAISHSGSVTTIQQSSQNMVIDWQSYNVGTGEKVQYIQPNASSLSLNQILSNSIS